MTQPPATLGEKLGENLTAHVPSRQTDADGWGVWVGYVLANSAILTALTVLPLIWVYLQPDHRAVEAMMLGLIGCWSVLAWIAPRPARSETVTRQAAHFLLSDDPYGFMEKLRLDQKTALFDGSNLYHFGLDNDLGAIPTALIIQQLRTEGYRIISFFDANIFYTLIENGDYPKGQRHSITQLQNIFGLAEGEAYIVPSGVQADKYILSTLKHLPVSFAVTNDRFRDYAKTYGDVMKGTLWRKGIAISKNEIRLTGHRFKSPVRLKTAA
ncbi:MAG: hypothetical protein ACSHWY_07040 [Octadecabacter sp.]